MPNLTFPSCNMTPFPLSWCWLYLCSTLLWDVDREVLLLDMGITHIDLTVLVILATGILTFHLLQRFCNWNPLPAQRMCPQKAVIGKECLALLSPLQGKFKKKNEKSQTWAILGNGLEILKNNFTDWGKVMGTLFLWVLCSRIAPLQAQFGMQWLSAGIRAGVVLSLPSPPGSPYCIFLLSFAESCWPFWK